MGIGFGMAAPPDSGRHPTGIRCEAITRDLTLPGSGVLDEPSHELVPGEREEASDAGFGVDTAWTVDGDQVSRRIRSSKDSRRTTTRAPPSETNTTAGRGTLL